jgi:hypothetical protein
MERQTDRHRRQRDPVYGRRIGTKRPIVKATQGQARPVQFGDDTCRICLSVRLRTRLMWMRKGTMDGCRIMSRTTKLRLRWTPSMTSDSRRASDSPMSLSMWSMTISACAL